MQLVMQCRLVRNAASPLLIQRMLSCNSPLRPAYLPSVQPGCGSALRDGILDWEDALPEDELALSGEESCQLGRRAVEGGKLQQPEPF